MSEDRRVKQRRRPSFRSSPRHSHRQRIRWCGHQYSVILPPDLSPHHAALAMQLAVAAVRTGAPLEGLTVPLRVGATNVAVPVKILRDHVLIQAVAPAPPPTITVDEAIDKFLAWVRLPRAGRHRKGEGGSKADERSDVSRGETLKIWWLPDRGGVRFGALPLAEVRSHHLEQIVIDLRLQNRPSSTTNKFARMLVAFSEWALAKGLVDHSLVPGESELLHRDTERPRTRRLTVEEYERLAPHCSTDLRALMDAALATACCAGELVNLRWSMVDLPNRLIVLPAEMTKTSTSRSIPITARLMAVLEMRKTLPDGKAMPGTAFVFGDSLGHKVASHKTAWRAACRRAGISGLRFHDLRRTAATSYLTRGVPLHQVSQLLGHTSTAMTATYLSSSTLDLQRTIDAIEKSEAQAGLQVPAAAAAREEHVTVN